MNHEIEIDKAKWSMDALTKLLGILLEKEIITLEQYTDITLGTAQDSLK